MSVAARIRSGLGATLVLFAGLFLLMSGLLKAGALEEFEQTLREHALIGEGLIPIAARLVPGVEILLGVACVVALCRPRARGAALWLVAGFFLSLSAYCLMLQLWPPPKPVGCGCGFSKEVVRSWALLAFRNGLAASVAGVAALFTSERSHPHPLDDREPEGLQPGQVAG